MSLTTRQQEIKDEFIRVRGAWSDSWESVLKLDPEFLASYLTFSAVPWRKNHLDDKVKEFIYIAVDANATHMYLPGVRQHIRAALALGATPQEIMEVLELAATLGIHAMNIGVPILVEVLEEKGLRTGPAPLTDYQEEVKAEFTKTRGYWHSFWDEMLELDPELFAAYTDFSAHPWRHGTLEPKIKELVYIAFDTAATHLYVKGLKLHIENAVGYGATAQEILEVMEIASVLGIHAVTSAAPILAEEAAAAGHRGRGRAGGQRRISPPSGSSRPLLAGWAPAGTRSTPPRPWPHGPAARRPGPRHPRPPAAPWHRPRRPRCSRRCCGSWPGAARPCRPRPPCAGPAPATRRPGQPCCPDRDRPCPP